MSEALRLYFDALDRLIKNCPLVVPKGTKISNDSVSLEAGRGKGSIKRSRAAFAELIAAIRLASDAQHAPELRVRRTYEQSKLDATNFKALYEAQLAERAAVLLEMQRLRELVAMLESDCQLKEKELGTYKQIVSELRSQLIGLKSANLRVVATQLL